MKKWFSSVSLAALMGCSFIPFASAMDSDELSKCASEKRTNLNSFTHRIDKDELSNTIENVSKGCKDFYFVPITYSDTEKEFLNQLKIELPKDVAFAKNLMIRGLVSFSDENKGSRSSRFNQANDALIKFFHDNTNANKLGENFGLNGPVLLARIILDLTEQVVHSKETKNMNIIVRVFKENDYLLTYPRWHFDGYISETRKADLAFAGALVGAPTVFANIKDDNKRYLIQRTLDGIRNGYVSSDAISAEAQLTKLREHRDKCQENQEKHNNFTKAANNFNALHNNVDLLRRHYNRRLIHEFMENNDIIASTAHAQPFQLSVFNMYGTNPALHSEPHIEVPRMFFSIQSEETPPYGGGDYFFINYNSVEPEQLF